MSTGASDHIHAGAGRDSSLIAHRSSLVASSLISHLSSLVVSYTPETHMRFSLVQPSTMLALRRDAEEDREREWVARARAGDEDAFRLLMDRHRGHAVAIALRITRSREDAED